MSNIITVEGVSKLYYIGDGSSNYGSLRDALSDGLRNPLKSFRSRPSARGKMLWALKDLTFDVREGEILGIIGRNGAGKSTILKVLSRIAEPTSGRIALYGRVGSLLEVGTGFHPELTGRENVFLNGAILGMKRQEIKRKFDEIVAFSEVEKFIDTPVKRYSSGMYVRLAFAVAAHLDPEILIIDEVLAVGDVNFQSKCLGKMNEVARGGRTVIFVSHSPAAVMQLCTSCIWMDGGRAVEKGATSTILGKYLTTVNPTESYDGIITDQMHYHVPSGFAFTRVSILDEDGEPSRSAYFGTPLRFRIEFTVRKRIENIRIALGIHKFDERVVCVLHHTDGGRLDPLNLEPGDYAADVSLEAPLAPGTYCVGLSAKPQGAYWSSEARSLDYVWKALSFDVAQFYSDGRPVPPTETMLMPGSVWSVDSVANRSIS